MKKLFLISFICLISIVKAQEEKRLALVIGNAKYEKGALKNPVNDALLIAKTLKSLDFDVILDTNLQTEKAFKNRISEFGEKRKKYDCEFSRRY